MLCGSLDVLSPTITEPVKLKVFVGALVWISLITLGHLQLNVGWSRAADQVRVWLGLQRPELVVGFLPVT